MINDILSSLGIKAVNEGVSTGTEWIKSKGEKIDSYSPVDGKLIASVTATDKDAYETMLACYNAIIHEQPLPRFTWTLEKDGSIKVHSKDTPTEVKLWQATNPDARDFRMEKIGPKYQGSVLTDQGGGTYVGKVDKPSKGWTAFFVELKIPSGCEAPFKFTTQVRVIPDALPYKFVANAHP